jgi:hypothetical protein
MKKSAGTYFVYFLLLAAGIALVVKLSGPRLLKLYVQSGMGDCSKSQIFCMFPDEQIIVPAIDEEYLKELIPYEFPMTTLSFPRGFDVVFEMIKKPYYKKSKHKKGETIAYILHQPARFFVELYPQLQKQGVVDDYEFIKRMMNADVNRIKGLTDAFFVIMKGIFTPDLGDQKNVKMLEFRMKSKKGFLNYNPSFQYFDCNIFDEEGEFFKIYIKDSAATLDLNKVFTIISTVSGTE